MRGCFIYSNKNWSCHFVKFTESTKITPWHSFFFFFQRPKRWIKWVMMEVIICTFFKCFLVQSLQSLLGKISFWFFILAQGGHMILGAFTWPFLAQEFLMTGQRGIYQLLSMSVPITPGGVHRHIGHTITQTLVSISSPCNSLSTACSSLGKWLSVPWGMYWEHLL